MILIENMSKGIKEMNYLTYMFPKIEITKLLSYDRKSIFNHIFLMLYQYSSLYKGVDDELNKIRSTYFIVNQIMIFISIV